MKLKINGSGSYVLKNKFLSSSKEFKVKMEGDTLVISNKNSINIDNLGNSNSSISINGSNISFSGDNIIIDGVLLDTMNKMSNVEDKEPGIKELDLTEDISEIIISGSSSLIIEEGNMLTTSLNCIISGSSEFIIKDYKSNMLNLMISGSSYLKIKDSSFDLLNINSSGSSKFSLEKSVVGCMIANLSGASSVNKESSVIKNLTSNCSGVAKIK